ncbi:hypothetical protein HF675_08980 [Serratia sp. JUb9]|uniref:putative T6SS immunity periplasmic lipoprotein n=1 Tax=Serratia sp. JUb9 TaxID=2724469 RepID=UPI00164E95C1|nr:putative T6SS immunity periplasmic lipoprotein [Serratia sp. JUb9]QNK34144.1 hypothetical protein HF675_08980 [Serratia sp. JUb9]
MLNIKLTIVVCSAVLLVACESRLLDIQPADVTIKDNRLCVSIPAGKNEYLNGLQIVDAEGRIFRKYLAADASVAPIPVLSGRCIPDFGYPFNAGGRYGIQVETFFKDMRQPGGNSYSASFRLYREQGVLKVARAG